MAFNPSYVPPYQPPPVTPTNVIPSIGEVQPYQPQQNELTSSNLNALLNENSVYMQNARKQGERTAQSRGLLNSGLAGEMSQKAAIEAGYPIAQADANVVANENQISNQAYYSGQLSNQDYNQNAALSSQEYGQNVGLANVNNAANLNLANVNNTANLGLANTNNAANLDLANVNNTANLGLANTNNAANLDLANVNNTANLGLANVNNTAKIDQQNIIAKAQTDTATINSSGTTTGHELDNATEERENFANQYTNIVTDYNTHVNTIQSSSNIDQAQKDIQIATLTAATKVSIDQLAPIYNIQDFDWKGIEKDR